MNSLNKEQIANLYRFNPSNNGYTMQNTLVQLFDSQCDFSGNKIAVEYAGQKITYSELKDKADHIASLLIQKGVQKGDLVGLCYDRSFELIAGLLGILKAGAAYVPFDPSYPSDRIEYMIKQSELKLVLADSKYNNIFSKTGIENFNIDFDSGFYNETVSKFKNIVTDSDAPVYVLFTSGSTGVPKGVVMVQGALTNLLEWQSTITNLGTATRTLQFAPISFDVSFQEILSTLTTGGTLVLIDDEMRLNAIRLLEFINENKIERLFLPFIALQHLAEVAGKSKLWPSSLLDVITAGEQLQSTDHIRSFFTNISNCKLHNHYGPTETHVVTAYTLPADTKKWDALPPIGTPVSHTHIYLLDEKMLPVNVGGEGEIYIAGASLAKGYLNNATLTKERFIEHSFEQGKTVRLYKTGDIGVYRTDGTIEYLGRADNQVKVRGYRIEPGEIEVALLKFKGVIKTAVIAREDIPGDKRLVAYLVTDDNEKIPTGTIRSFISSNLPEYMIPSAFVFLESLPLTPSGKIDRKSLPPPDTSRPDLDSLYVAPKSEIEINIASLWSDLLRIDKVGVDDNFFFLGGNSLLALQFIARLRQEFDKDIPVVKLYQSPTIRGLLSSLNENKNIKSVSELAKERFDTSKSIGNGSRVVEDGIAIIGMSGRFPGSDTIDQMWNNLIEGKETTKFFSDAELDSFIDSSIKSDSSYIKARGVINDPDKFDASFFNINPRIATLMDPQQRIFLEVCWEALESAGYSPSGYKGLIGVYAGMGNNTYYTNNVIDHKDTIDKVGSFQVMVANEKDYIATRISHVMNLKGPAISVHTACSTSLTAVAMACQGLWNNQCDMAMAGGVSITSPVNSGHLYLEGGMFSSDGHTRPFDEKATGTVFSDGSGVVVLKRYKDAVKDGDTIYAVIRGVGINNDGADKASFTAPSVEGQAAAIAMAHASAHIDPQTISYIETHGTATPLGDPIEIEALSLAFGPSELKQYCAVGSIKSNFGHLTAAAGVTGLIKTVLSLKNKILPPSLHYSKANPSINFEDSPFYVNSELKVWERSDTPLRAGISSFGVGGTNVHLVIEETPEQIPSGISRPVQLLIFSSKSKEQTETAIGNFKKFEESDNKADYNYNLADAAFTLQTGRTYFKNRKFIVCNESDDINKQLSNPVPLKSGSRDLEQPSTGVAFMFPGQGSQYVNMGLDLYRDEIVFKEAVDRCSDILNDHLDVDLRTILYPAKAEEESAADKLKLTYYTQPALFTIGYALSKLWQSWGVLPSALIGHSIGEFCAACVSGVMSLEDALLLVANRGRMMQELPSGSMLSVRLSAVEVKKYLPENVSVAAINGPSLCVVSGEHDSIDSLQNKLEEQEIVCKKLFTSHAFHSVMMDPIVEPFKKLTSTIKLNKPSIPIYSTATAKLLDDNEATNPEYWSMHLRNPVLFADGIKSMWNDEPGLFLLELGPRNTASTLARQQATDLKKQFAVPSLSDKSVNNSEWETMLYAVGQLWLSGINIDWESFYALENRKHIALPTYPFANTRYWVDPVKAAEGINTFHMYYPFEQNANIESGGKLENQTNNLIENTMSTFSRKSRIINELRNVMEDASGIELASADENISFLELGMDSLFLTQAALTISKKYGTKITFRQLNEEFASLASLAQHIDETLPADAVQPAIQNVSGVPSDQISHLGGNMSASSGAPGSVQWLIMQQMQIMQQQLAAINGVKTNVAPPVVNDAVKKHPTIKPQKSTDTNISESEKAELEKPFGAIARIEKSVNSELSDEQKKWLKDFTEAYTSKTKKSKEYTQQHRAHLADPRVVTGFKPNLKELIYQAVVDRSEGCSIWDIDGNEYVDVLNGFGSNFLGYASPIIMKAVEEQLKQGIEIGPQHPLAGVMAEMICDFTGYDRAGLCNTGSEAVLGAMRIARTVTGRATIVCFNGSYHGINDEVIVRGAKNLKSYPAAAGIMPESVQNMLVLDYGTDEALEIIRSRADDIAAVLVEPIQSRRADFRPKEFLEQVREITTASGAILIFDEVITGFRLLPGGAQEFYGIKADISTYGKVIGGGMPIGAIAGRKEYMDALDGGYWEFGDSSVPEAGVTYFAGTFVRHPLALAAGIAVLKHLKERGNEIYDKLNGFTDQLVHEVNIHCKNKNVPFHLVNFGSLFKVKWDVEQPYGELIFLLLRQKGVHIYDGFPCFVTDAFSQADINFVISQFINSIDELQSVGFLTLQQNQTITPHLNGKSIATENSANEPPVKGARKGTDQDGNPAWFISDPDRPGKFIQVN